MTSYPKSDQRSDRVANSPPRLQPTTQKMRNALSGVPAGLERSRSAEVSPKYQPTSQALRKRIANRFRGAGMVIRSERPSFAILARPVGGSTNAIGAA